MHDVVINNRSNLLTQDLILGNSTNTSWTSFDVLPNAPVGDGVWPAGHQGIHAARRVFIAPYCQGPPGSQFSVRVYAWEGIDNPDGTPIRDVFIPFMLAEFACVACNRPGPVFGSDPVIPVPFLQNSANMCDTMTLTQGALGLTGEIVSTGPGTDLIAFAMVELRGARFFQFDFLQNDPVGMNCFWARA